MDEFVIDRSGLKALPAPAAVEPGREDPVVRLGLGIGVASVVVAAVVLTLGVLAGRVLSDFFEVLGDRLSGGWF